MSVVGFPGTTVVVPALNEEACLPVVLADIRRELEAVGDRAGRT